MSRRFVDARFIRERMDGKDRRIARETAARQARQPLVVCDGWTDPKHDRIVLVPGNPALVSHGICTACLVAVLGQKETK